MPTIRRVAWRPFAIPLRDSLAAAHGTVERRAGVVVLVETSEGLTGLGEASPLPSFAPGTVADVLGALPHVADRLLGKADADEGATAWRAAEIAGLAALPPGAASALRFAIEGALASIEAERAGLPMWRWLAARRPGGGDAGEVGMACVPVNALVGAGDPAETARRAAGCVAAGFRTIKLKAGFEPRADIARLEAVRRAVGPDVRLRLDANGGWPFEQAVAVLSRAQEHGVELVEQPVAPGPAAMAQFATLSRMFPGMVVAADESLRARDDVRRFCELTRQYPDARLAGVLKPTVLGLRGASTGAAMLGEAGCAVIVTTTIEAGIGTATAMHLAASLPEPRQACGLGTLELLAGDIARGVPPVSAGEMTLPEGPGLGVELDDEAFERHATAPWCEVCR
ncbi:MAG: mandelate racemase/muconate lactonizing enzyme family protein [Chloroflexi bacterium]|nr:mandelate racemase/muconate lactonizing enzyme family protein [Chloroflexota bacterium]